MKEKLVEFIKKVNKGFVFNQQRKLKASFRSVVLPTNYFVPNIHFSMKSALKERKIEDVLFCEIEVNGRCVFREYTVIETNSDLQKVEEETLEKLYISLITHALGTNYDILEKYVV